ncbi:MAG: hypothetical protein ACF8XB_17510 [Planctomycetota bacterium JB042]
MTLPRPPSVLCLLALVLPLPTAAAQLPLTLSWSFTDHQAGGNGATGVTQDEISGHIYVIDFSDANPVHEFDEAGTFLAKFPTVGCTPSAPSPNDGVWDPQNGSIWMAENSGDVVVEMSQTGACLGGFATPGLTNASGITLDRATQTLFVAETGTVTQYDKAGNVLGGGFSFSPPTGFNSLSGITSAPPLGNFLITQTLGTSIFEVSPTGALVSITDLAPFGVVSTMGIHYNHTEGTLLVVDNLLSTTFVFEGLGCAVPTGSGCAGSGGFVPTLDVNGCAHRGATVSVTLSNALGGASSVLVAGLVPTSASIGFGCDLLVAPPSFAIPVPLGGSGPGAGAFTLPGTIPLTSPLVDVHLQAFVADPGVPLGIAATNGLRLPITP